MDFRAIYLVLAVSCLPLAGCGTVSNLVRQRPGQGGVVPFGGVQHDVASMREATSGNLGAASDSGAGRRLHPNLPLFLVCAADVPFSFIGDVLTWPYTFTYTYINQDPPVPPVALIPGTPAASTPGLPDDDVPSAVPFRIAAPDYAKEPKKAP